MSRYQTVALLLCLILCQLSVNAKSQAQGRKDKRSGRDTAMRALAMLERLAGHVSDAAQGAQLTEALLPLAAIKTVRWTHERHVLADSCD